jgi:hypothetical protein
MPLRIHTRRRMVLGSLLASCLAAAPAAPALDVPAGRVVLTVSGEIEHRNTPVLLRELLVAVGARGKTATAIALNDYRVDIPVDEAMRHDLLVAWLLDDKPMAVRDKGPLVVIYPFDSHPELRTALNYSRAAWQLKQLDLR